MCHTTMLQSWPKVEKTMTQNHLMYGTRCPKSDPLAAVSTCGTVPRHARYLGDAETGTGMVHVGADGGGSQHGCG